MGCPRDEVLPPMAAPEVVVDEPSHKHIRVGALDFCYRDTKRGWEAQGAKTNGTEDVVTIATWREAFVVAGEAMHRVAHGQPAAARTGHCPECAEVFAYAPAGRPPYQWACGPEHHVASVDGYLTVYDEGGRRVEDEAGCVRPDL